VLTLHPRVPAIDFADVDAAFATCRERVDAALAGLCDRHLPAALHVARERGGWILTAPNGKRSATDNERRETDPEHPHHHCIFRTIYVFGLAGWGASKPFGGWRGERPHRAERKPRRTPGAPVAHRAPSGFEGERVV